MSRFGYATLMGALALGSGCASSGNLDLTLDSKTNSAGGIGGLAYTLLLENPADVFVSAIVSAHPGDVTTLSDEFDYRLQGISNGASAHYQGAITSEGKEVNPDSFDFDSSALPGLLSGQYCVEVSVQYSLHSEEATDCLNINAGSSWD